MLRLAADLGERGVAIESHLPCPDCGSTDALSLLSTGTKCHSCGVWTPLDGYNYEGTTVNDLNKTVKEPTAIFTGGDFNAIEDRGISKETAKLYGVRSTPDLFNKLKEHYYPYYKGNQLVAQKVRIVSGKRFYSLGTMSKDMGLFGQQLFPKAAKQYCVITEGELDAMAAYQMTSGLYPCISVPNGATSYETIQANFEYLNNFRCIALAFDNDKVGQEAATKIAKLFGAGKCKILQFDPAYKDACDYLKAGKGREFTEVLYNSAAYSPSGIVDMYDLHEKYLDRRKKLVNSSVQYPFKGLNDMTYGLRTSEVVVATAPTGIGKTEFIRSIQNNIIATTEEKLGVMYLEEDCADTYGKTLGMQLKSPIHLPDTKLDEVALQAERERLGRGRVYVYDHFGSVDFDEIVERIRYFAQVVGCRYIILDHISMLVSDQRYNDERKALDAISTKLKSLTMELDICIIAIVHLNREGLIRGSAAVEQLANIIIKLDRDNLAEDEEVRNQTKVIVTKNRFSGKTGEACTLQYSNETNSLVEIPTVAKSVFSKQGAALDD